VPYLEVSRMPFDMVKNNLRGGWSKFFQRVLLARNVTIKECHILLISL
jgi:hypothetical protein